MAPNRPQLAAFRPRLHCGDRHHAVKGNRAFADRGGAASRAILERGDRTRRRVYRLSRSGADAPRLHPRLRPAAAIAAPRGAGGLARELAIPGHRRMSALALQCGLTPEMARGPESANKRLMHCSKQQLYSITSSARVSSVGGTMMPSAFAVFKLITSSNLVGCSTGRSAGFAPLKILSTKTADRRNKSGRSGP